MIFTESERNFARDLFARLRDETVVLGGGVTRVSYGLGETKALHAVAEAATRLGLDPRTDRAGNLYVAPDGAWPDGAVVVGSHLDSVPSGGNYDGLAGVIAGLLVAKKAKDRGSARPIVALGLRGEESAWFGVPYIGSKLLLGKLPAAALHRKRRDDDRTLGWHIASCGLTDTEAIAQGERLLPADKISEFWELHIEQGPVLQAEGIPVGIVTGIRGNVRTPSAFAIGEPGHSGTTPHRLRKDAVVRFAELIVEMEHRRQTLTHIRHVDLMATCGIAATDPASQSLTSIAGRLDFTLDIRSMEDKESLEFLNYLKAYARDTIEWGEVITTPSAWLDNGLRGRCLDAAIKLGITFRTMASGAGHDAAVFQQAGVPSGMVFVRNQHGSHNPHEAMDIDDFMCGVEVLWQTLTT